MSKINESQVRQEILILEDQLKSLGSLSPENQHLLQQLRSAVEQKTDAGAGAYQRCTADELRSVLNLHFENS